MKKVTVAATQMSCSSNREENLAKAEKLIRRAATEHGAQIILIQELFETLYFCQDENHELFGLATPVEENPAVQRFQELAEELSVVLPCSFFEKANQAHYNSLAMIDADGSFMGVYRKSHIPDGPGYEEKFYFNPGDTGFKVWTTRYANIGVGICWDQWYPECARSMALMGADLLFYPTAIGSEPHDSSMNSCPHWQRVMQGHSGANIIPVIASNRVGSEKGSQSEITFYGGSFITDEFGEKIAEANTEDDHILTQTFDLEAIRLTRAGWGFFRDRRPELYKPLSTLDGKLL